MPISIKKDEKYLLFSQKLKTDNGRNEKINTDDKEITKLLNDFLIHN